MNTLFKYFYLIALSFCVCACNPKTFLNKQYEAHASNPQRIEKGKRLLRDAIRLQNFGVLDSAKRYELIASDAWSRQFGININPWVGDNGAKLRYQMAFNTFDSKVTWLSGDLKGVSYGIQSWQLYRQAKSNGIEFIESRNLNFIIPTMHYFMELPYRLSNAPIIFYVGEEKINSIIYDKVFTTWNSLEVNEHDQYILFINRNSGLVERTSYTIRKNFMWTPKNFYGTAVYSDFREVSGIFLPHKMEVFAFDKTNSKVVHTFKIDSVKIGGYEIQELYPIEDLPFVGDSKPSSE